MRARCTGRCTPRCVPGGTALHTFPTLYEPAFMVNRVLPERVMEPLLRRVQPGREPEGEHAKFRAYYRWCRGPTRRQLRRLESVGFQVLDYVGYFGHGYFGPLKPLDRVEQALSHALVRRPAAGAHELRDGDAAAAMSASDAAARTTGATVVRGGLWTALSHVVPQLYVLALSIAAARFLSPSEFGRQSFISFIAVSVLLVLTSGMALALMRSVAEAVGAGRTQDALAIVAWAWRVQAVTALAGGGALVVAALLGADPEAAWVLAGAFVTLGALQSVANAVLLGVQRFRTAATIGLVTGAVMVPVTIAVFAAGGGIIGLFAVEAAVAAVNLACSAVLARRALGTPAGRISADVRRATLRFVGWTTANALVTLVVWRRSEFVFLAHYSTDVEIALYSIAFATVAAIAAVPERLSEVLVSAFATLRGADATERIRTGFSRSLRLLVMATLPLTAGVAAVGPELLRLVYGDEYREAGDVLLAVVAVIPFLAVSSISVSFLSGLGDARTPLVAGLFAAVGEHRARVRARASLRRARRRARQRGRADRGDRRAVRGGTAGERPGRLAPGLAGARRARGRRLRAGERRRAERRRRAGRPRPRGRGRRDQRSRRWRSRCARCPPTTPPGSTGTSATSWAAVRARWCGARGRGDAPGHRGRPGVPGDGDARPRPGQRARPGAVRRRPRSSSSTTARRTARPRWRASAARRCSSTSTTAASPRRGTRPSRPRRSRGSRSWTPTTSGCRTTSRRCGRCARATTWSRDRRSSGTRRAPRPLPRTGAHARTSAAIAGRAAGQRELHRDQRGAGAHRRGPRGRRLPAVRGRRRPRPVGAAADRRLGRRRPGRDDRLPRPSGADVGRQPCRPGLAPARDRRPRRRAVVEHPRCPSATAARSRGTGRRSRTAPDGRGTAPASS